MIVWICFEAHAADGQVWAVKARNRWMTAAHVQCLGVELQTVYRPRGPEPKAYLRGSARVVYQDGDSIILAP